MPPDTPAWVQRWQQGADDELLSADASAERRTRHPVDLVVHLLRARGVAPADIDWEAIEVLRQYCDAPAPEEEYL